MSQLQLLADGIEWAGQQGYFENANPRTAHTKSSRKRTALTQNWAVNGDTDITAFHTQQALQTVKGADAPPGTLERFGDNTTRCRLMLTAAKNAMQTKDSLLHEVVNGEVYKEKVFAELEKCFCQDYEQSVIKCWTVGFSHCMKLRQEDQRRAMDEARTSHQLRQKLKQVEEENAALQVAYNTAVEEIRKLHEEKAPNEPPEENSEILNFEEMQKYCDQLFTEDGFLGEISGEIDF